MQEWRRALTDPQRRVLEGLLGWGTTVTPRPAVDRALVSRLRSTVDEATRSAADLVPAGERLALGKSALEALSCDGRFVDRQDTPFEYSGAMVRGQLAHAAIALDLAGRRERSPVDLVRHVWSEFAAGHGPAGAFARQLDGVEADALRADATAIVLEFRDVFPQLPDAVPVRCDPALGVTLHEGRVGLYGRPDLAFGRVHPTQRRLVLVDLKSGWPNPWRDRAEMRFYALLATLKYGAAPFRVATFYLDDASWDVSDVDAELLDAAVRTLADKAERAARLTFARPPRADWELTPGPACGWCGFAADCLARAAARRREAAVA